MSLKKFDDNCPGCKPVVIDVKTKRPVAPDSPLGKAIEAVWVETTLYERECFHNFCCLNDLSEENYRVMTNISRRITEKAKALNGGIGPKA